MGDAGGGLAGQRWNRGGSGRGEQASAASQDATSTAPAGERCIAGAQKCALQVGVEAHAARRQLLRRLVAEPKRQRRRRGGGSLGACTLRTRARLGSACCCHAPPQANCATSTQTRLPGRGHNSSELGASPNRSEAVREI